MRTPIVAGNWKMNTTVPEGVTLAREILARLGETPGPTAPTRAPSPSTDPAQERPPELAPIEERGARGVQTDPSGVVPAPPVEVVVCPPFVSIVPIAEAIGERLLVGAQDVFWEEKGAYTGEVAPGMLAPYCRYVIVGHSERRQYFGETDESVNRKVKAVLRHGMRAIMCVGENLAQNEAGQTAAIVAEQVRRGLAGLADVESVVIAYEPIWAIGTGRPATGPGANAVIGLIRRTVEDLFGGPAAGAIRIQYGGSVNAANAREFLSQPEIDGALVGGASLKAAEFIAIIRAASPDLTSPFSLTPQAVP